MTLQGSSSPSSGVQGHSGNPPRVGSFQDYLAMVQLMILNSVLKGSDCSLVINQIFADNKSFPLFFTPLSSCSNLLTFTYAKMLPFTFRKGINHGFKVRSVLMVLIDQCSL